MNYARNNYELCEFVNHTFVTVEITKEILSIEGRNRITGQMGRCVDKMLCSPVKRKCKIIGSLELGEKLPNSTYTGILGLLQTNQVDLNLKGETEFLNPEPWLRRTLPLKIEKIVIGHSILERTSLGYFDLLSNFELGLEVTAFYMVACLLTYLLFLVLIDLSKRVDQRRKKESLLTGSLSILKRFLDDGHRFSPLDIFLVCANFCLWHTLLFLSNNIKTNKVTIDTSEIVLNSYNVFQNPRIACFLNHEDEMKIALNSPKGSFMHRLFHEKTKFGKDMLEERKIMKKDRCLGERDTSLIDMITKQIFLVGAETFSYLSFFFLEALQVRMKIWYLNQDTYQFNTVLLYNMRNPINRKNVEGMAAKYIETGINLQMDRCIERNAYAAVRKNVRIYKSLNELYDDILEFSDLVLPNFQSIFLVYFLICLIILGAYLAVWLAEFFAKKMN